MNTVRLLIFALLAQAATSSLPQPPATASIEGVVVRLGTNEPVANADVELSRVEGTAAAPLPEGAAEVFARDLVGGGNTAATVPVEIRTEVKYFKTRSDGKFSFTNLKEGKYRLVSVHTSGALHPAEYLQRDPRGRGLNFPVAVGQPMKDVRLEMAPTGSITGRVTDADGQPMGHVRVAALEPSIRDGRRYLAIMEEVHTDEHGDFRLFWLSPGHYYVSAKEEDLQRRFLTTTSFPPGRINGAENAFSPVVVRHRLPSGEVVEETTTVVYNGGVLDPDQARPLELLPGMTVSGADIPMAAGKVRTRHIRGVIVDPAGKPFPGAGVIAIPRQSSASVIVLNTAANAKGEFDIAGAAPGSYALFASTSQLGVPTPQLIASAASAGVDLNSLPYATLVSLVGTVNSGLGYVSVDMGNADLDNVRIATTPGINVPGHASIEGTPDGNPDLAKIKVSLTRDPDILTMPSGMVPLPPVPPNTPEALRPPGNGEVSGKDGKFNILAAPGDFKVIVTDFPAKNYVKSIRMGNLDLLNGGLRISGTPQDPIDIVIGTDAGEVSGIVLGNKLEAMSNVMVALVPESTLLRRRIDLYRTATTDFAGKFKLDTVAPGNYKLFSWEYVDANAWQDVQFLQTYETFGKSVTVREGSKQDTSLTVIPVRR